MIRVSFSAPQIQAGFRPPNHQRVSTATIRRRLHRAGLYARRLVKKAILMMRHRAARLQWARAHSRWTRQEWANVLFTDEMRMCLRHVDGRARVWRRRGEQHEECCVQPITAFGGGSVMVWAGMAATTKTPLILINGHLNANRYVDEILHPHVVPVAAAIGDDFELMDDNARPHRARVVDAFLAHEGIQRMVWPANSPDLNPLEHLWDQLKRAVSARINANTNLADLAQMLEEEWNAIPQQRATRLVNTMRRRCQEVIDKRGGYTHY